MNVTDAVISIIDRFQSLYEWFLKIFGRIVDLFERFKEFILSLVEYVLETFDNEEDVQAFLKNYLDNEHSFI
ncbi:hypothetical protein H1R17_01955 [Flavobacterium sp. xlx-214]|uniref:hypothetical protein n=1 Tax=unclassified Flavobacterium TaxID=196869 RepID=UPI0013D2371A|nr:MULTISPECIES: hypothetical protein [unclassified Flavobacterium]MBA5792787.1 hypothetical protein [Flavobacterium sp. xlx-221]QMI83924.1 hypothetical protein H1R17_01955 [Flavobacterium sp. xlx-214]